MLQFLIIARDGVDDSALDRRIAVRSLHFEGARKLKDAGNFILGGATLDEEGRMNGSMMVVQFETEKAMRQWFDNEPYVTGKVWQQIEVRPFKVADV